MLLQDISNRSQNYKPTNKKLFFRKSLANSLSESENAERDENLVNINLQKPSEALHQRRQHDSVDKYAQQEIRRQDRISGNKRPGIRRMTIDFQPTTTVLQRRVEILWKKLSRNFRQPKRTHPSRKPNTDDTEQM